ncbi:MAG: type II toxin-antitoxin system VapC family toxin [Chloroflexi bacterium]|nr:type II toxin-antitoxin system VapC family toxin [Chloroflexota bacterium]MBU1748705.1 type II toxin-antitoxin system VapC family toxin [Chloroflexota bacterium]
MAAYYFDTSGLVKYYLTEQGSAWVQGLLDAVLPDNSLRHDIQITPITVVEAAAAIARRRRMGQIGLDTQQKTMALFMQHVQNRYTPLNLDESLFKLATDLTQRHPLRGYDAIHLAAALRLRAYLVAAGLPDPIFVSADANQCVAARAEGLTAENPNDHS